LTWPAVAIDIILITNDIRLKLDNPENCILSVDISMIRLMPVLRFFDAIKGINMINKTETDDTAVLRILSAILFRSDI